MRILLTGHLGYIGAVMAPFLNPAGHDVTGLDTGYFADCGMGPPPPALPGCAWTSATSPPWV